MISHKTYLTAPITLSYIAAVDDTIGHPSSPIITSQWNLDPHLHKHRMETSLEVDSHAETSCDG